MKGGFMVRSAVQMEWNQVVGDEQNSVERIGSELIARGSEPTCLRLEHRLRAGVAEHSSAFRNWVHRRRLL